MCVRKREKARCTCRRAFGLQCSAARFSRASSGAVVQMGGRKACYGVVVCESGWVGWCWAYRFWQRGYQVIHAQLSTRLALT